MKNKFLTYLMACIISFLPLVCSAALYQNEIGNASFSIEMPIMHADDKAVATKVVSQVPGRKDIYVAFGNPQYPLNIYRLIVADAKNTQEVTPKEVKYFLSLLKRNGMPVKVVSQKETTIQGFKAVYINATQTSAKQSFNHNIYIVAYGNHVVYFSSQNDEKTTPSKEELDKFAKSFVLK